MPTFSWPRRIWPERRPCSQLCRSVPQIPASSWRKRTVPGAGSGTGYSRISNSLPIITTARPVRTTVPARPLRPGLPCDAYMVSPLYRLQESLALLELHRPTGPSRLVDALDDCDDAATVFAGDGGVAAEADGIDDVAELVGVKVGELTAAETLVVLAPFGQLGLVLGDCPDVILSGRELPAVETNCRSALADQSHAVDPAGRVHAYRAFDDTEATTLEL